MGGRVACCATDTRFTYFTGTKVQILTQKAVWAAAWHAVLQHNIHGEYVVPCRGWVLPDRLVAYANALLNSTAVDLPAGLRLEPWSTRQLVAPTQVVAEASDISS